MLQEQAERSWETGFDSNYRAPEDHTKGMLIVLSTMGNH